jgi:SAM-dependent methyltransferase
MATEEHVEPSVTVQSIAARPFPACLVCGAPGLPIYDDVKDRLFSAPGAWSIKRCTDAACGLLWLDPMPLEEDIGKAYQDYYTHADAQSGKPGWLAQILQAAGRGYIARRYGYAECASAAERLASLLLALYPGQSAELDLSVMWLPATKRGRVLDIGSGSGWLVENLNALGWRAEGLDFDPRAVANARQRGLTVHLGGLTAQRFPADAYDAITMCHSIEHVHDPLSWLREVHRVVRPAGRLVIATPNTESLGHHVFGRDWLSLDPPRHLQLFNADNMERLLRAAGFTRVQVFTSPRHANGVFIASRAIRRSGHYAMAVLQPPGARLLGRLVQVGASLMHRVRPRSGEDLVAIAEK